MERGSNGTGTRTGTTEQVYRFGVFELSPESGELRKNGVKIRLSGQPFQILVALLQKPGDVVTREQLRRELWPADTYVDFDHCLNTAVNKVREALGDAADNPRFVQTLPRIGYRFLAPVDNPAGAKGVEENPVEAVRPVSGQVETKRKGRRTGWLAAGVLAVLAGGLAWAFWPGEPVGGGIWREAPLNALPGTETTPAFSPDGTQAAFSWNGEGREDFDIYVQTVGSGAPRQLTSSPAHDLSPAYSPDGRQIAFYRSSGDYTGIYLVSPSGGAAERLGGLGFGPRGPSLGPVAGRAQWLPEALSWSPDQTFLAVVDKSSPEAPPAIFLRDIESREMRQFTFPPAESRGDGSPAFSPDGTMIAFVRHSSPSSADIYLGPLSGDPPRRLTSDSKQVFGLAWLRDGQHIVFSSNRAGGPVLWKVSVAGGEPGRIAGISEGALFPAVPRQGGRLAYVHRRGENFVWRVRLRDTVKDNAGGPLRLRGNDSGARYSPDGRRIAYSSQRGEAREIWVADAQGENAVQLTSFGTHTASPRWSPDGRRLAFDSDRTGNWGVYVIDAGGGELRQVTHNPDEDVRPSWSRDGKWIYFGSDRSGTAQLWKMPAEGRGNPIQVTRKGGYDGVESPDGQFLYYTRRGVHGLWRIPVRGGEEKLILAELQWQYSRNWALTAGGVCFMSCPDGAGGEARCFASYRNLKTGATERVAQLGNAQDSGFSISPDGEWLLYTKKDDSETEIIVVENFR